MKASPLNNTRNDSDHDFANEQPTSTQGRARVVMSASATSTSLDTNKRGDDMSFPLALAAAAAGLENCSPSHENTAWSKNYMDSDDVEVKLNDKDDEAPSIPLLHMPTAHQDQESKENAGMKVELNDDDDEALPVPVLQMPAAHQDQEPKENGEIKVELSDGDGEAPVPVLQIPAVHQDQGVEENGEMKVELNDGDNEAPHKDQKLKENGEMKVKLNDNNCDDEAPVPAFKMPAAHRDQELKENGEMKVELNDGDDEAPVPAFQMPVARQDQEPKQRVAMTTFEGDEIPMRHNDAAMLDEADYAGKKKSSIAAKLKREGNAPIPVSTDHAADPTANIDVVLYGGGRGEQQPSSDLSRIESSGPPPSYQPVRHDIVQLSQQPIRGQLQHQPPIGVAAPSPQSTSPPPNNEENLPTPTTLDASLIQSVEATPFDTSNENNVPNVPDDESRVVYMATQVNSNHKKYIIVVLMSTIFGVMAGVVVMLVGRANNGAGGGTQSNEQTTTTTMPPASLQTMYPSKPTSLTTPTISPSILIIESPAPPPYIPPTNVAAPGLLLSTPALTPKPVPSPMAQLQLQSSAMELFTSEDIISHSSHKNVAIYGDTAIVGAPYNEISRGFALVYIREDNGGWMQHAKLVSPDGAAGDQFGYSVGIFGDTVIVGAHRDDGSREDSGSVYVFVRNGDLWIQQVKLVAPDGAYEDLFGNSVGIHGDTVVIGASWDGDNGKKSGSVYLFMRNGDTWTQQAKLLAPDGAAKDFFGRTVGIFEDTIIIGAWGDDNDNKNSGSVHLFARNGDAWTHQAKLVAPDGADGDLFGKGVGIFRDTAIVGAWGDDDNGEDSGSVYLFVRNGDVWTQQAKLVAPDATDFNYFGWSVGIFGDTAVVSAHGDCDNGERVGSIHLFVRNGDAWTHHARLLSPNTGSEFGKSVAIYNGTVIGASPSGQVYVFSG